MRFIYFLIFSLFLAGCSEEPKKTVVRVGHLPNLTHAQALIGQARGSFEKSLAPDAKMEWKIFNAGPSVIEGIFANQLDIAYAGPSPAINGYVRSQGEALRVIAGAASGGAALVVRVDSGIKGFEDFRGKRIASPQLGNTQDVSLRAWISGRGLKLKEKGGDVQVLPLSNSDQMTLFIKKEIDAAWTVEPWVSLLVANANGKVFLEESTLWPGGQYATTLVLVRKKFLDEHPGLVKKFLLTHVELTDWIHQNPLEAGKVLNEEIKRETGKAVPENILSEALKRVRFTYDPMEDSVIQQGRSAFTAGFLKKEPELSGLFDLHLLKAILETKTEK